VVLSFGERRATCITRRLRLTVARELNVFNRPAASREVEGCQAHASHHCVMVSATKVLLVRTVFQRGSIGPLLASPSDETPLTTLDVRSGPLSLIALQNLCYFCRGQQTTGLIGLRLLLGIAVLQPRIDPRREENQIT
jgi:hypothetical protein